MDMKLLEQSPHIAPLLVKLYEGQRLYDLAKDSDNPHSALELTEAVAELLEQPLSAREESLVSDVLIALARQAQMELRMALTERLAAIPYVPLRVILFLANDQLEIATPILQHSPVLSDIDLLYIIKAQGPGYWQAIAARESLSEQVINALADTQDEGTAIQLTENDRINLTTHAMKALMVVAQSDAYITRKLSQRPELTHDLAKSLYEKAAQDVKAALEEKFDLKGQDIDLVFAETVSDLSEGKQKASESAPQSAFMPTKEQIHVAESQVKSGTLNMTGLFEMLSKGKLNLFIAMFSALTGLSAKKVHDFLCQPCPKGLAISCRAFRINKSDFTRIYLLTHRMRSADRMIDQSDLQSILSYYDGIKPDIAEKIIRRTMGAEA